MTEQPVAIRLEGVTKTFPGSSRPAVECLDLTVPEGGITVLVGPSGCGKTTTLKMINRFIEPSGGRLEVLGTEIRELPAHELRRQIGYVIQQIGLFPHKTIAENIATVPKLLGWDRSRTRARVRGADRAGRPATPSTCPVTRRPFPAASSNGWGWRGPSPLTRRSS